MVYSEEEARTEIEKIIPNVRKRYQHRFPNIEISDEVLFCVIRDMAQLFEDFRAEVITELAKNEMVKRDNFGLLDLRDFAKKYDVKIGDKK